MRPVQLPTRRPGLFGSREGRIDVRTIQSHRRAVSVSSGRRNESVLGIGRAQLQSSGAEIQIGMNHDAAHFGDVEYSVWRIVMLACRL